MINPVRPVNCLICRKPLFYNDSKRYKPEWTLSFQEVRHEVDRQYVHQWCWAKTMDEYVGARGVKTVRKAGKKKMEQKEVEILTRIEAMLMRRVDL